MRRTDLQALAQAKLDDAVLLLDHRRWSNAYYLAGYGVELGLKACIARQISSDTIPDRSIIKGIYSHVFRDLVGIAGLKAELEDRQKLSADFGSNWAIAAEWSPDDRYRAIQAMEAQYLISAVGDPDNGVLQWIKIYW